MRKKITSLALAAALLAGTIINTIGVIPAKAADDVITIRVCNWEEYIDEGGWDEEELIDLESGDIFGENALYEDFEE